MRRRQYLSSVASIGAVSALGVQSVGADTGQLSSLAAQTDGTMTIGDREGDDYGPGTYTYPTNDQLPEGCFDVTGVEVEDTGDHWEFTNHMGTVPNSFGGDEGFSVQVFQLYIQDPNAPDDAPSTSEGREGVTSTFQEEYHYRVHVMTGQRVVEDAEGNVLAEGIPASGDTENNTISFSIPKEPFDSDSLGELNAAMLVFSQDGFGVGGIRQSVGENAGEWAIGGADPDAVENAPKAMDLVGPETIVDQEDALSYSADAAPSIPLYSVADLIAGDTISDPEGDDNGPGTYTYPTNDQLPEGCFDVTGVDLQSTADHWEFTNHMGTVPNSFGGDEGFSVQVFQLYIHDTNAPDDAPATAEGREGVTSTFQEEYHYRVHVMTGQRVVEDAEGNVLAEGIPASGDTENNTISFSIPKEPFDSDSLDDLKMTMLVFSQDGFGVGGIRQSVGENAGEWAIGGADPDAVENAPKAMELVGPEDVVKQEESLAYSADSVPTVPLFDTKSLVTGEVSISLSPVAAPIGEVWGTLEGTLDGTNSSGPEGVELTYQWEQTSGPEAEIADPSAAETTFTAPDVDEETEIEFTLTISDPDGNEATDTTTATVIPQSENDAPTADAGEDQTVDPGDTVSLQAVNSEDPNGGSLSYQWEQTAGPEVDLVGPDSIGAAFKAPEVEEDTDFVFELTVNDGQGKTATDSITITVRGPEETETPTETETETEEDTGDGFGPGFGAVTGLVGAAGGAAYAAKRRLGGDEDEE